MGMAISSVYNGMEDEIVACPGGIMITCGSSLWEAPNAATWTRLRTGDFSHFMQRWAMKCLLEDACPADVDEFGKLILHMTFGRSRREEWEAKWLGY
jgi:hypothetical protein